MNHKRTVTERNWTEYFAENRERRLAINWQSGIALEDDRKAAFVASLQRFQVGESGEGNHLKQCAAQTGDADYCRAIELFIAEENYHAQMLEQVLRCLKAPTLKGHWSDFAFIVIRRFSGLEMELMILLVAELIAKRYYRALHDGTRDENVRAMCVQILRDENAHVTFHCDTLSRSFAGQSSQKRAWTRFWWKRFYRFVCRIVAWDHRGVLQAAHVTSEDWMRDTDAIFEHAATRIFAPSIATSAKNPMEEAALRSL